MNRLLRLRYADCFPMRKVVALCALLLLCTAAGVWRFGLVKQVPVPTESTSSSVAVVKRTEQKTVSSSAQPSANSASRPNADAKVTQPFAVVRAQLEEQANKGDALAALRLGKAFALCNGFVHRSDSALSNLIVDAFASGMTMKDRNNGAALTPGAVLRIAKLSSAQRSRDCADVIGLDEDDAPVQAFKWIERAAVLGNLDAQAMYGALAFTMFDSRSALANADIIRDRKALGTEYLRRSLEQGNALALLQSSNHYATGLILSHDGEAQYAYLYAYSLTPRSAELMPEILQYGLDAAAETLDENALQRARIQGQLLARCCGGSP